MTHKQLQYFLKTAETLNMTKAAKALYISQPSLSEQMRRLERELGTELFIRKDKSLKLTLAGKTLIGETYELFAKERELIDAVRTAGIISKRCLNIHCLPGPLPRKIPHLINLFHQQHPDIMLNISSVGWNALNLELSELQYDVAFQLCLGDMEIKNTEHIDLLTTDSYVAVAESHPLALLDQITFEDVRHESFSLDIFPDQTSVHSHTLYDIFTRHGAKLPHVIPSDNIQDTILNIRSGLSIGILAPALMESDQSGLRFLPWKELHSSTMALYWNQKNTNPAIPEFVKFIKAAF